MGKTKGPSLTVKTKELLREAGIQNWKTEHWNSFARKKTDLFEFIDMVALGKSIVGIQVTSASNRSARREKILASPYAVEWVLSQGAIWLLTWDKCPVERGGKRKVWVPTLETFSIVVLPSEAYPELCSPGYNLPTTQIPGYSLQVQSVHKIPLADLEAACNLLYDLSASPSSSCPGVVPEGVLVS